PPAHVPSCALCSVVLTLPPPQIPPPFPYTTLFRSVLNGGYRKGATVTRRGLTYAVYSPKVFILIGDVFDTLRDRSIVIEMWRGRSEEHTSELQSRVELVCRPLLEKKKAGAGGADEC